MIDRSPSQIVRVGQRDYTDEVLFELTERLEPGDEYSQAVGAWELRWDASLNSFVKINSNETFPVQDHFNCLRGRGPVIFDIGDGILHGSRGRAKMMVEGSAREIIYLQPHALRVSCRAQFGFEETDAYFMVYDVHVKSPTGGILLETVNTVYNIHQWTADAGALIDAEWNEYEERFEGYQVDCPV